jgi:hypothetical protein
MPASRSGAVGAQGVPGSTAPEARPDATIGGVMRSLMLRTILPYGVAGREHAAPPGHNPIHGGEFPGIAGAIRRERRP